MSLVYYGPHLHAAMKCFAAGYRENAVSWMERDIGEADDSVGGQIDPDSLHVSYDGIAYKLYSETKQGLHGEGI